MSTAVLRAFSSPFEVYKGEGFRAFAVTIPRWRRYLVRMERTRDSFTIRVSRSQLNTPRIKQVRAEEKEYRDWARQFKLIDLSFDEKANVCGKCGVRTMWFMGEIPSEYCINGHAWDKANERWTQGKSFVPKHESARGKFEVMRENDLLNIAAREAAIAAGQEPPEPLAPHERGLKIPM